MLWNQKSDWLTKLLSDNVTYWAVLDSLTVHLIYICAIIIVRAPLWNVKFQIWHTFAISNLFCRRYIYIRENTFAGALFEILNFLNLKHIRYIKLIWSNVLIHSSKYVYLDPLWAGSRTLLWLSLHAHFHTHLVILLNKIISDEYSLINYWFQW